MRWLYLATAIRVSPRQYPHIHQMLNECATTLDLQPVPELYIEQDPTPQRRWRSAWTSRSSWSATGMLQLIDDEGLRFIIGHEVGHVLSGHAVYRTMLLQLINLAAAMAWLPIGAWSIRAIIFGLNEWFRKSELSCDRAGLLCSQDPNAALRVHASLAGAQNPNDLDIAAFLDQAEEYETHGDVRDSVLKLLQTQWTEPPTGRATGGRIAEVGSRVPAYAEILAGNYPRRSDDKDAPDERGGQGRSKLIQAELHNLGDPLYKLVGKIGSVAGRAGGTAANRVRDWWRSGQGGGSEHMSVAGGRARRPG